MANAATALEIRAAEVGLALATVVGVHGIVFVALVATTSADVDRIQHHLVQVEVELRGVDISTLGPTQRRHRARLIDELRAYRERGVFPRQIGVTPLGAIGELRVDAQAHPGDVISTPRTPTGRAPPSATGRLSADIRIRCPTASAGHAPMTPTPASARA